MSYGSGGFTSNEKVELSLKTALQRVQTDLERKWFNEPNSFNPKTPQENFRFNVPNYNEIKDYLLIDPNVDGEGTSMITNVTVANFIGLNSNGALFTLDNIRSGIINGSISDKIRSEASLSNASLRNYVDGTNNKQIKGLGPNMFTRYSYYKGIENNGSTTYFAGKNWQSSQDPQDPEEPFNSIINLKGDGTLDVDSERNITIINQNINDTNANSTKFYNNLISAAVPISIIKPPTDWNSVDVTKSHPFIKVYIQVPTYASKLETNSDNIAFTNPVLKSGLGDTYGYQYFISGWNGSKYEKLTTSANEFLFYNSTAGIITVYGQSDPINGTRMSQKYPPMVSFIRYTGETLGDGIISQGDTLPAVEVSNDKDLFINTTENTIHRLQDSNGTKEWIPIGGSGNSDISFNDTRPSSVPTDFEENQLFVDTSHNIIFRVDDNNGNKSFEQISEKILSDTGDPSGNINGYTGQLYIRKTKPALLYYNNGGTQWLQISGSGGGGGANGGTQIDNDQILTQTSNEVIEVTSEQLLETDSFQDISGSSISYTFPVGSTSLIYRFRFNLTWNDENNRGDTISEYQLQISTNQGDSYNHLKTFRLRNSVFSENFAIIEHVIEKDSYANSIKIKLVGKSINTAFKQKIHYSYLPTSVVVKPILELVSLGTKTIQGKALFSKNDKDNLFYTQGNVGIGTDDPTSKLELYHNSYSIKSDIINIRKKGDETNNTPFNLIHLGTASPSHNSGAIKVFQNNSKETILLSGNGLSYFDGGNVGIGTTDPSEKLDVSGNINVGKINLEYDNEINCNFGNKTLYLNYNAGDVNIANSGAETKFGGPVTIGKDTPNELLKISRTGDSVVSLYFGGNNGWGSITSDNNLSLKAGDDTGNGNAQSGQLFLDTNGNVGIGTTEPTSALHVWDGIAVGNIDAPGSGGINVAGDISCRKISASVDQNIYSEFGRARIGAADNGESGDDLAYFSHSDNNTTTDYALKQDQNGVTYLNAKTGKQISFRINNSEKMRLHDTGNVTIPIGRVAIGYASTPSTWNAKLQIKHDAQILSIRGNSHEYMSFFRGGDTNSHRSGYIGYSSSGSNDLTIVNERTGNKVKIANYEFAGDDLRCTGSAFVIGDNSKLLKLNPNGGNVNIGGNVGIGLTNPSHKLVVHTNGEGGDEIGLRLVNPRAVAQWDSQFAGPSIEFYGPTYYSNQNKILASIVPYHKSENSAAGASVGGSLVFNVHADQKGLTNALELTRSGDTYISGKLNLWKDNEINSTGSGALSELYLNYSSDGDIFIGSNSTRNNNVFIGNTGGQAILNVNRSQTFSKENHSGWAFWYDNNDDSGKARASQEQRDNWALDQWIINAGLSIYGKGAIFSGTALLVSSDKRIKENVREVNDSGALKKVRDISCVYYEYRDKLNKGFKTTIGFIAQQVREHLPLAISLTKKEIPSVYKFIKDFTWETITDVSNNTKQKLHFNDDIDISSNAYYKFYTTNDLSANDLEQNEFDLKCCENNLKSFVFDQSWNYIFLYGEIVNDFHALDKQKLFALNFSATQEIDKIQQQQLIDISGNTLNIAKNETDIELLKLENSELKTENADLKTELATLKTQMTDVLSRLSQLENN